MSRMSTTEYRSRCPDCKRLMPTGSYAEHWRKNHHPRTYERHVAPPAELVVRTPKAGA